MRPIPFETGRVVLSRQGRDCGRYFLVCEVLDENHVRIVDGKCHKLCRPKLKKIKHLKAKPFVAEEIRQMLESKQPVQDAQVRKALASFGFDHDLPPIKEDSE